MKVLMINHFPLAGSGSGTYTKNLAVHLAQLGHEVCVILPENTDSFERVPGIRLHPVYFSPNDGAPGLGAEGTSATAQSGTGGANDALGTSISDRLPFNFPCFTTHPRSITAFDDLDEEQMAQYTRAFTAAIEEEIGANRPDVIHGQHVWVLPALAAGRGIPLVLTAHGTDLMGYDKWPKLRSYAETAMDACSAVISISKDNCELLEERFPQHKDKIVMMRNGYDPGVFYPDDVTREEVLVGNVSLINMDNPLAFNTENMVPAGWTIVDDGEQVATGALAGVGPRIFKFTQAGQLPTALYVRQKAATRAGYAEFGTAQNYGLSLVAGNYNFSYFAAAWQGAPYLKCEVFDKNNHSLGSQIISVTKNVDRNLNTGTYDANYGVVNFTAPSTGYYHVRWTPVADQWGNGGDWLEVVLGHIKISHGTANAKSNQYNSSETTAIQGVATESEVTDGPVFNLQGIQVAPALHGASLPAGIYIHHGKKITIH